jgi:hypothetical protein
MARGSPHITPFCPPILSAKLIAAETEETAQIGGSGALRVLDVAAGLVPTASAQRRMMGA